MPLYYIAAHKALPALLRRAGPVTNSPFGTHHHYLAILPMTYTSFGQK